MTPDTLADRLESFAKTAARPDLGPSESLWHAYLETYLPGGRDLFCSDLREAASRVRDHERSSRIVKLEAETERLIGHLAEPNGVPREEWRGLIDNVPERPDWNNIDESTAYINRCGARAAAMARTFPAVVAQLQSAEARLAEATKALEKCAAQFSFYEGQHRAKGTPEADEKAETNAAMAAVCRTFLEGAG